MTNFKIIEQNGGYIILPTTPNGGALMLHCQYHGEDFTYPTRAGEEDKVMEMDSILAITNKLWAVYADEKRPPATAIARRQIKKHFHAHYSTDIDGRSKERKIDESDRYSQEN